MTTRIRVKVEVDGQVVLEFEEAVYCYRSTGAGGVLCAVTMAPPVVDATAEKAAQAGAGAASGVLEGG